MECAGLEPERVRQPRHGTARHGWHGSHVTKHFLNALRIAAHVDDTFSLANITLLVTIDFAAKATDFEAMGDRGLAPSALPIGSGFSFSRAS